MNANVQDESKAKIHNLSYASELFAWCLIPAIVFVRLAFFMAVDGYDVRWFVLKDYYWDVVIAMLILVFPIFFRQIFGVLPLKFIMLKSGEKGSVVNIGGDYIVTAQNTATLNGSDSAESQSPGMALLLRHAVGSRALAQGIYGRAGVYLLVGVLVAFSGLIFFYTQTSGVSSSVTVDSFVFLLAPKFGILFFIEYVAFFFLRQYRSAMEEFRYYESIARRREEVNALLKLSAESASSVKFMEFVKNDSFFSKGAVLEKGQTTETLEARKLEKGEIELLEKVVDTIAKVKR